MAASQSLLNRGPFARLGTAAIAAAPTDGTISAAGTAPHRILGPQGPTGLQCTGFFLGLKAPSVSAAAAATAAGFSVIVWVLNPLTNAWFSFEAVSIAYSQAFVSFDVNASSLYYQIEAASVLTPGDIDFHAWEQ